MIQLTLGKLNVSWKNKSIIFNNQRGEKALRARRLRLILFAVCNKSCWNIEEIQETTTKWNYVLREIFSCPLLNICGSNFLVLLKSLPVYFRKVRKLSSNRCLGHLWVCLDKAVRWTLFWNVNQFIKRQTGLLLLCLLGV